MRNSACASSRLNWAKLTTALTGVLAIGIAGPAFAQASDDQPSSDQASKSDSDEAIIVTGTRIRGLEAPTGSNLVTVSTEEIQATGASDATQLVNQTISQLPTFNTLAVGSGGEANTVPRLGLRGFGNAAGNASGGTATLVLFNGHRVVFTGWGSSDVDPNSIPAEIIGSVQVMPDGGSSAYGSDAVGGVINFVTKKRLDGVEVHLSTSQADHYHSNVATLTTGKTWDTGSVLASVNFSNNNALLNKYRSWSSVDYTRFGGNDYRQTTCGYGSFIVNGTAYVGPDLDAVGTTQPKCEQGANSSMVPKLRRVNVFGYFEQELAPNLKFTADAFYSRRETSYYYDLNSMGGRVTIDDSNPYFTPVDGETSQTVDYSYAPALGLNRESPLDFTTWQVSPGLSYDVDGNWKVNANFIYGYSRADIHKRDTLSADLVNATNINPYDTSEMPLGLLGSVANYEANYYGVNKLKNAQLSADGDLYELPGGAVKLAVGGELLRQELLARNSRGPIGNSPVTELTNSRDVEAVFGELFIPLFGPDNARPGIRSLDVALAARYDHYSDFGGTFNPRIGVNYRPFEDLLLRANYQTTFTAASLADSGLNANVLQVIPMQPAGTIRMYVAGTGANLKPMEGKTFSVGFDWTPDAISGLSVSATYWNTKLKNIISQALAAYGGSAFASRTAYALCGVGSGNYAASANGPCTEEQVQMIQDTIGGGNFQPGAGLNSVSDIFDSGTIIATLIDARRGNFGLEKIDGIDFQVGYNHPTSFGSVFGEVGGSYILNKKIAATATAAYVDYLSGDVVNPQTSPFGMRATVGAGVGPATVRMSMNYSGGYDIPPGTPGQDRIGSFTVFNFSGTLDLGGIAGTESNQLEFGIDNVFKTEPPWNSAQGTSGYPSAGTIGRVFRVGIRSNF